MSSDLEHPELPEPGYVEVLGTSIEILDQLIDLRSRAQSRLISLGAWRSGFADATFGVTLPNSQEQAAMLEVAMDALLDARTSEDDAASQFLRRLVDHLGSLDGPPTDEEVREQHRESPPEIRRLAQRYASDTDSRNRMLERADAEQALLDSWVMEIDGFVRDPICGLPVDEVARFRQTEDPDLGLVPVSLTEARARAWLAASPDDKSDAAPFAQSKTDSDWKVMATIASMSRVLATEFIAFAQAQPTEEGRAIKNAWGSGDLSALLADFLDRGGR